MIRSLSKSTPMMVIISLHLVVMIVVLGLAISGNMEVASLVGTLGPLLIFSGALTYIVSDSKKKWPDSTATQRLMKAMTFTR